MFYVCTARANEKDIKNYLLYNVVAPTSARLDLGRADDDARTGSPGPLTLA